MSHRAGPLQLSHLTEPGKSGRYYQKTPIFGHFWSWPKPSGMRAGPSSFMGQKPKSKLKSFPGTCTGISVLTPAESAPPRGYLTLGRKDLEIKPESRKINPKKRPRKWAEFPGFPSPLPQVFDPPRCGEIPPRAEFRDSKPPKNHFILNFSKNSAAQNPSMSAGGTWRVKKLELPKFSAPNGTRTKEPCRGGRAWKIPKTRGFTPKSPSLEPKIAQFGAKQPQNRPVWSRPGRSEAPRVLLGDLGLLGKGKLGTQQSERRWKSQIQPAGVRKQRGKGGKTWKNAGKVGKTRGETGENGGNGQRTYREERGVGGEREFDAVVIKVGIAAGPGHAGGSSRLIPGWN